jgi:hypothetical protein
MTNHEGLAKPYPIFNVLPVPYWKEMLILY